MFWNAGEELKRYSILKYFIRAGFLSKFIDCTGPDWKVIEIKLKVTIYTVPSINLWIKWQLVGKTLFIANNIRHNAEAQLYHVKGFRSVALTKSVFSQGKMQPSNNITNTTIMTTGAREFPGAEAYERKQLCWMCRTVSSLEKIRSALNCTGFSFWAWDLKSEEF